MSDILHEPAGVATTQDFHNEDPMTKFTVDCWLAATLEAQLHAVQCAECLELLRIGYIAFSGRNRLLAARIYPGFDRESLLEERRLESHLEEGQNGVAEARREDIYSRRPMSKFLSLDHACSEFNKFFGVEDCFGQ